MNGNEGILIQNLQLISNLINFNSSKEKFSEYWIIFFFFKVKEAANIKNKLTIIYQKYKEYISKDNNIEILFNLQIFV
jgi:hypothetical protein